MNEGYLLLGIMLFLLLAVGIGAIIYNLRLSQKIITQFEYLGQVFGLDTQIPKASLGGLYQRNPTLYGFYKERELSVYPRGYGMDNTRQTDIAIRLQTHGPEGLAFSFGKRNALTRLGQIGRLEPVSLDVPEVGEAFSLRSNNPGAARALFTAECCRKLAQVWKADSGLLVFRDKILTYEESGLPRSRADAEQIEAMTRFCLEIADTIDAYHR